MIAQSTPAFLIDALVFDAYGTLFDVQSVAATVERLFPGRGAQLSQLWRSKQLEYSWLQSLMQSPVQGREDFAAVTAHALDYAAEALGLSLAGAARHRVLDSYLDLSAYADAAPTLARLGPRPRLILSNGTRAML
jgi:2-haloacid dehalogenase